MEGYLHVLRPADYSLEKRKWKRMRYLGWSLKLKNYQNDFTYSLQTILLWHWWYGTVCALWNVQVSGGRRKSDTDAMKGKVPVFQHHADSTDDIMMNCYVRFAGQWELLGSAHHARNGEKFEKDLVKQVPYSIWKISGIIIDSNRIAIVCPGYRKTKIVRIFWQDLRGAGIL